MTYGKVLHTEQHGERIVNVRKDIETGEYRARLYTYGKAYKPADYFTNDLDDAMSTAGHMARCTPASESRPYTVVLMRPDYLCEIDGSEPFGQNCYVANRLLATGAKAAIALAQKEVSKADKRDGAGPVQSTDYYPLLVFEGHIDPRFYGWQL